MHSLTNTVIVTAGTITRLASRFGIGFTFLAKEAGNELFEPTGILRWLAFLHHSLFGIYGFETGREASMRWGGEAYSYRLWEVNGRLPFVARAVREALLKHSTARGSLGRSQAC